MPKRRTETSTTVTQLDIFGPPPLIEGEDEAAYNGLLARVSGAVNPADVIEDIWVRDVVDLTWEIFRLRRMKAYILNAETCELLTQLPSQAYDDGADDEIDEAEELDEPENAAAANENDDDDEGEEDEGEEDEGEGEGEDEGEGDVSRDPFDQPRPVIENAMAHAFAFKIGQIERFDDMIAAVEARRNGVLHEIDRRRASVADRLRRAAEIEDAEFEEVPPNGKRTRGRKARISG